MLPSGLQGVTSAVTGRACGPMEMSYSAFLSEVQKLVDRADGTSADSESAWGEAFEVLRWLKEQEGLATFSSSITVHGDLTFEIASGYIETRSDPEQNQNVFCYRVRMTNTRTPVPKKGRDDADGSPEGVPEGSLRLVGRQYRFYSGRIAEDSKLVAEVPHGSVAVVGHMPLLEPGDQFEFSSGTVFPGEEGIMLGSYRIVVPKVGDHPSAKRGREKPTLEDMYKAYIDSAEEVFDVPLEPLGFDMSVHGVAMRNVQKWTPA